MIHIKRSASGSYRDEDRELHKTRVKNDGEAKTKASLRNIIVPQGADNVLDAVKALNLESEFIFTNKDGEVFSRSAMNHKLGRICEKPGIEHKSTHGFRKTYLISLTDLHITGFPPLLYDQGNFDQGFVLSIHQHLFPADPQLIQPDTRS